VPRWLMSIEDAGKYECEFDFDAALLRADMKTRMESNAAAINSGQCTPNEARISEGKTALDGGNQLLIQGAMVPIQQAGQKPVEAPKNET
jgi:hypothetical protein